VKGERTQKRWREALEPAAMQRVALAACSDSLRDVLVQTADEGCVQLEDRELDVDGGPGAAAQRLLGVRARDELNPTVSARPPDLDRCERL
jgi:hypothetical protein